MMNKQCCPVCGELRSFMQEQCVICGHLREFHTTPEGDKRYQEQIARETNDWQQELNAMLAKKEAEERRQAERARKEAEERKQAEQARKEAEERKQIEQARKEAEERRQIEQARKQAEERRQAERARKEAEERRQAEQARKEAEERRQIEQARIAEEAEKSKRFDELKTRTMQIAVAHDRQKRISRGIACALYCGFVPLLQVTQLLTTYGITVGSVIIVVIMLTTMLGVFPLVEMFMSWWRYLSTPRRIWLMRWFLPFVGATLIPCVVGQLAQSQDWSSLAARIISFVLYTIFSLFVMTKFLRRIIFGEMPLPDVITQRDKSGVTYYGKAWLDGSKYLSTSKGDGSGIPVGTVYFIWPDNTSCQIELDSSRSGNGIYHFSNGKCVDIQVRSGMVIGTCARIDDDGRMVFKSE